MASPGRLKVGLVGALIDLEGTKAGLLVDRFALETRFFVVFEWGGAFAGELENVSGGKAEAEDSWALRPSIIGFLVATGAFEVCLAIGAMRTTVEGRGAGAGLTVTLGVFFTGGVRTVLTGDRSAFLNAVGVFVVVTRDRKSVV